MYVKYMADVNKRIFLGDDNSVYENIVGEACYKKGIYFYADYDEIPFGLRVIGYEKALPDKAIYNRVFKNRLVIHYCIGGSGYYNDQPISKGKVFLTWPNEVNTLVTDPDDPMEFYWIMIRGNDIVRMANKYGFNVVELIFDCDYMDEVVPLFECLLTSDYTKVSLEEYTSGMLKAVLSFQKNRNLRIGNVVALDANKGKIDYVNMAKSLLCDSNYTLSVSDIAKTIGLTPKYLITMFKKTVGESPKRYATNKRLEIAARLLEDGLTPKEVAESLKYADYVTFYRAFTDMYGISPTKYVEKTQNSEITSIDED